MKIDQTGIIPPPENRRFGTGPCWAQGSLLSAESSHAALWSFCYLYCHFADTIPNSAQVHRYGPGFADNKDSLQSNTSCRSSKGAAAPQWFSAGNFSKTCFEWNLIKFSVQTNKLYSSLQANIHGGQNIWGKTQIHKHKGLQAISWFYRELYFILKGVAIFLILIKCWHTDTLHVFTSSLV